MKTRALRADGVSQRESTTVLALTATHGDALDRAIASCRLFLTSFFAATTALRLRPLVKRFFYPSVRALRLGRGNGIDGLALAILDEQCVLETGTPLPSDLPLTSLAAARANMLPRALARTEVRLLFEQHVVGPLHVLLVSGNYRVEGWVRDHSRDVLDAILAWLLRRVLRRAVQRRDPVAMLRHRPDAFSALVWRKLWALAELEEVLAKAVPSSDTKQVGEDETDPIRSAVNIAMLLDTDHASWSQPDRLLRDLHRDARAASCLAPEHAMVRHVARRVHHAVQRFQDFEEAYEVASAQDPPPEWMEQAFDAVDSEHEYRGTDSAAKLVRRIACRLWVNGTFPLPSTDADTPDREPTHARAPEEHVAINDLDDDVETGF